MIQNILSNVINIFKKENDLEKLYKIEKEIYSNSLTEEQKNIINKTFKED